MYLALPDLFKRRNRIRDKTGTFFHKFSLWIRSTRCHYHVRSSLIGTRMRRGCSRPTRIRILGFAESPRHPVGAIVCL